MQSRLERALSHLEVCAIVEDGKARLRNGKLLDRHLKLVHEGGHLGGEDKRPRCQLSFEGALQLPTKRSK